MVSRLGGHWEIDQQVSVQSLAGPILVHTSDESVARVVYMPGFPYDKDPT